MVSNRIRIALFVIVLALVAVPGVAHADLGLEASGLPKMRADLGAEAAAAVPSGFEDQTVFTGLTNPSSIRFAPDGRIFIAQKNGQIKVFDGVNDTTPTIYADLRTKVDDYWDRGLLGMALDPQFTSGRPYVYVLYTYDAAIGGTAPRWNDACPTPPGPTTDGCVVSGRLSRLDSSGNETVLINDWCQQYPSHSIGDLQFGPDGALYASAGDGASFNFADYGQAGNPKNPCGDPPAGVGGTMSPPTAEGGALRSQDVRSSADPTGLDGAILRVDPDTGAALPSNPGSGDANARRIVAYGFRNPFRFTFRPGTSDLYAGDVGWDTWEEIDRVPNPTTTVTNLGWPCYEGAGRQPNYDALNLNLCESLYSAGTAQGPLYAYNHSAKVSTESCPTGSSSVSGLAFYNAGTYPSAYQGALFFSDYSRRCIWVMSAGANGVPDPSTRRPFVEGAAGPVYLAIGPDGDLWYVDLSGGTVHRVHVLSPNGAPTARVTATPTSGAVPLTVSFDGTGSSDPDGDALTYSWDLNGDGTFGDSTAAKPTFTYNAAGTYTARLRVSDPGGLTGTDSVTIVAGIPPTASIDSPSASLRWAVGDTISFSGSARDGQGNALPASRLSWGLDMQHCSTTDPTSCHVHHIQDFTGVASGSFAAPDHEYPSYLELVLTATDTGGLTDTERVRLDPRTVNLTFETQPTGLALSVGGTQQTAPFTRTVIVGSKVGVAAPTPQTLSGTSYAFALWSDGGAAAHDITAPASAATYRATYNPSSCTTPTGLVGAWGFDEASGTGVGDASGRGNAGTISGATRTTSGKFGSALSFDGVNDVVTVNDAASLHLSSGMTLEGWAYPTALGSTWRTVAVKEQTGGLAYALYAHTDTARPSGHVFTTGESDTRGTAALALDTWTHLATTYDGSTLRLYVNGTLASSKAVSGSIVSSTGALRFGGNDVWGEWFAGRLDELRVYNRALSAAEVSSDMATPVTCAGPPPAPVLSVAPTSLSFSATQGGGDPASKTIDVTNTGGGTLSFTATSDQSWLQVTPASGSAPQSLTVQPRTGSLAAGTYTANVTVTASGASGSPKTVPVTFTVAAPVPPALAVNPSSLAFTATQGGANPAAQTLAVSNTGGGTLSFTAASDQSWLQVTPASGTAPATLTVSAATGSLAAGTYTGNVTVTASGASGSPKTVPVTLTIAARDSGLVGAWGFDEASGTAVNDASGNANNGTINGATRITTGRFGSALSFDGINDWVTVNDASSLDLSTEMTLEAWVYPTAGGTTWRTAIIKQNTSSLAYALYGNNGDILRPSGHAYTSREFDARGTSALPLNTWTHLATTYDGATLRLYVNGALASSTAVTGAMPNTTGPLRFGGNSIWPEWFAGRLDEIRVYERTLTQSEIQSDMTAPVAGAGLRAAVRAARSAKASRRAKAKRRRGVNPGAHVRFRHRAHHVPGELRRKR